LKASRILHAGWALALAASLAAYTASVTPDRRAILARIAAQSLEGHVSFLASDLLEGRGTPSRGLDIAAEYIAAQFRRAGLKPVGDDGYFQTAHFIVSEQSSEGAELTVHAEGLDLRLGKDELRIESPGKADLTDVTPVKVELKNAMPEDVAGKVIVAAVERPGGLKALRKLKPAAAILAYTAHSAKPPESLRRLQDAGQRLGFPIVRVYDEEFSKLIRGSKSGPLRATLSLRLPQPVERPADLRNVAGLLPGSDPALRDTYILVTAHYDHLGKKPEGEGDLIFNGANDDASGVASVIEIASALAAARPAPRRSVLFMTYFGEEEGLLGSRYYGRHPLVPLKQTVADLNLEHLGRTDGDGRGTGTATMTGYGYTDITAAFKMAGEATGVKIYKPENDGDDFFARSDNQSLADQGVPDTTILTTFEFPDYHNVGDEWNKLDYPNLEKVDRAITLTVMMIADDPQAPRWNEGNSKTRRYVEAWRELK
jgi:Peptidase family M28